MQYTFQVTGMTCGHCEASVRRAVLQLDQQAEVTIEQRYTTQAVHQGYIEPQAMVALGWASVGR